MFITRKAEFSASHFCRLGSLSDEQNREIYGLDANPNGHGHNYVFEVTIEGDPDPVTGMIMDLKDLKQILEQEIVEPMDHRFLNHEVPPFDRVVPTAENLAGEIWRRLEAKVVTARGRLSKVRLWETANLYVDVTGGAMTTVTRRYRFAASHRLHTAKLSENENTALYGKCNNPFGHGHDYVLDVSVAGPVDNATGKMFAQDQLNRLVAEAVLNRFEHCNLNVELPEFQAVVPTTENISLVIARLLEESWYSQMPAHTELARVYVEETPRNSFEVIRK